MELTKQNKKNIRKKLGEMNVKQIITYSITLTIAMMQLEHMDEEDMNNIIKHVKKRVK